MDESERKLIVGLVLQEVVNVLNECTYLKSPSVSGFVDSAYVNPDPAAKIDLFAFKLKLHDKVKLLLEEE